ncbi:phosphoglycerate mutase-like protein [Wolfiporia cocos MD-104 SS10]|uniref:Phosphoglycerate mutase-like protein n=1 Tax=Wolfiporia cocos (strain MD-104) TaxID=742152 RepID=A0A2H3J7G5_WOLCO|nr:phosphoglycerate mutase-like protein [Wolfiporia cocos MD-104 SS10]
MAVARVYIVRHGETAENRAGIMQGQLDTKLNAAGIEQAQLAATALEVVPFQIAYSSDLDRAFKTAEIILQSHPDVTLEKQEALRERHLGDWQGQIVATRGSTAPANAEPLSDFSLRAARWWTNTIIRYVEDLKARDRAEEPSPACILAVSHGGYISRLVAKLLESGRIKCAEGATVNTKVWNASITVIDVYEDGQGVLLSYADTTHLNVDFVKTVADLYSG